MTRSYYPFEDDQRFRRSSNVDNNNMQHQYISDRNASMAMQHAERQAIRSCPVNRAPGGRNTSPQDDADANGQPRRRIAVACARCRKRKIRCSGDSGNGMGCQNCRSAGADLSACQFHRVGTVMDVAVGGPTGYSSPTLAASAPMPGHQQQYGSWPKTQSYPSPQYSSHPVPTRATYSGMPYRTQLQYGDDSPIEAYGLHGQVFATSAETANGIAYATNDAYRQYTATVPQQIIGNHAMFVDHEPTHSYTSGHIPYLSNPMGRHSMVTTEGISPFGMTSLHSSLPHPSTPASASAMVDRQLPAPTAVKRNQQVPPLSDVLHMPSLSSAQTGGSAGLNNLSNYSTSAGIWAPGGNNGPSDLRHSSINGLPTNGLPSADLMGPPSKLSGVSESMPDSGGLISYIATSTETSPTTTTALPYHSNPSTSRDSPSPPLNSATKYTPNTSYAHASDTHSNSVPRHDSAAGSSGGSLYTFSADSKRNSLGEGEGGQLITGQRYAPVVQPQPQHMASLEGLRAEGYGGSRMGSGQRGGDVVARSY
ncbi:hypothetical protein K402DRAFT_103174 [Aulographum hederae CBS 113979]|uniref:Zn(2)-C6 fungal-type domain-containing protein n=1 Tax=Aulographum hederae CBS 113979 TaxID=1176131 RepID=A0A6G1GXR0_9PEZI|nr:hypothetical protein K402DRAFT_103174 [Aulographum hederae CBS 113979]